MRISDWSSDVCSSDLEAVLKVRRGHQQVLAVAKMQKQLDEFPGTPFEALSPAIAFHADARGSQLSMETAAKAIQQHSMAQLLEHLEDTYRKFIGLTGDHSVVHALVAVHTVQKHGQ